MEFCLSGDVCDEVAVPSTTFPKRKMFCAEHQARLDYIREHMQDVAWRNNIRNKSATLEIFCETSGCDNRPVQGGEYCAECVGGDD